MSSHEHPIHGLIVDELGSTAPREVVDLGCGTGPTLAAVARRWPTARLIGLDQKPANIAAAAALLTGSVTDLRVADLDAPLDLPDGSVDAVVSHNVLECVADPVGLLDEAARVLRSGGRAVWSHTDFDTVVVNTADVERCRRVLHGYADTTQPWMAHSDARMGRKLAGLVRRSALSLVEVDAHVLVSTEVTPLVTDRLDDVCGALADHPTLAGDVLVWREEVDRAVADGDFLFAETTFVATAVAR